MSPPSRYVVTGANVGLGLESVNQLASLLTPPTTIYLLCRNEDSANDAISSLSTEYSWKENVSFTFVKFDGCNRSTVKSAIETLSADILDGEIINGLLLNAGGFTSDKKGEICDNGETIIAASNLIGHAALIDGLISSKKLGEGSRVVFSGSEAGENPMQLNGGKIWITTSILSTERNMGKSTILPMHTGTLKV